MLIGTVIPFASSLSPSVKLIETYGFCLASSTLVLVSVEQQQRRRRRQTDVGMLKEQPHETLSFVNGSGTAPIGKVKDLFVNQGSHSVW
jgi:hypothetical protein